MSATLRGKKGFNADEGRCTLNTQMVQRSSQAIDRAFDWRARGCLAAACRCNLRLGIAKGAEHPVVEAWSPVLVEEVRVDVFPHGFATGRDLENAAVAA